MDYSYMVVAFIEKVPVGEIIEPPKHPHITVKKKFKLLGINEEELIQLLQNDKTIKGVKELHLGEIKDYENDQNKIIEVLNPDAWTDLHHNILTLLDSYVESRDPHFEGDNYLPHVTWKLRGKVTLDPEHLKDQTHRIRTIYLIQRVDPVISRARVVALINL